MIIKNKNIYILYSNNGKYLISSILYSMCIFIDET